MVNNFISRDFSLQNPKLQSNNEKIRQTAIEGILKNTWPVPLKIVKVMKNKASLRNYHDEEEPK